MKRLSVGVLSLLATAGAAFARGEEPQHQVTVDYINFTVGGQRGDSAHLITFDVLSVEATQDGPWFGVDLNDDGEIAFIDSHIMVFGETPVRGGGKLGAFMGENDDDFENGFGDGTLYGYDSFLQLELFPGNYTLAISTYSMSEAEARMGVNFVSAGPFTLDPDPSEEWSNHDHGDYRIRASDNFRGATVFDRSGTIFVVPAPAAGLVLGLAGVKVSRRRR